MQAAVLRKVPGELEIEDLSVDAVGPHELLVRTAHSGLCHSDLHFIDGVGGIEPPLVMGHEGAGIVEAVGSEVTYVCLGDHVETIGADKLERALVVGATHTVNARDTDAVEAVREITHGGVDYSFEAIGTTQSAEQCFVMLRAARHRDRHRHGARRREVGDLGRGAVRAGAEDPGLDDGVEPLSPRHAVVLRPLSRRVPEARRDGHRAPPARRDQTRATT